MFRKPRRSFPSGFALGGTPSPPSAPISYSVEDDDNTPQPPADPILITSSPQSPKKQKFSHPVSAPSKWTPSKTPRKPRQSLLTPHTSSSAKKPGSSFGSSSRPAGRPAGRPGPKKNSSILSFFKPVTPDTEDKDPIDGLAKSAVGEVILKGAQCDELFVRHGGYDLEVSEPEDEGDGDENGWVVERSLMGELELAKGDDELFSSLVGMRSGLPGLPFSTEEKDGVDGGDMVMGEEVVDGIESTAPTVIPAKTPDAPEPVTQRRQLPTPSLKLNPASLNLDASRSIIFSQRGSTQNAFKKLKQATPKSSSGSSAEEEEFHDKDGGDPGLADQISIQDTGELTVEEKPAPGKKGNSALKRTREQAFMQDSEEPSSDSPMKKEDAEEALFPEAEEKLEDCNFASKPHKRGGSAFEDDEFEGIDDFPDEEINFEEQEDAYIFSPANRAEAGYEDFDGDFASFGDPSKPDEIEDGTPKAVENVTCPICSASIGALPEEDANNHVNHCLDGTPIPLPTPPPKQLPFKLTASKTSPFFGRAPVVTPLSSKHSAFSKLMSTNSESQAWASAAKSEVDSRGKKAADRTCPFYKILFNGSVTVDAFRYGSVPGCKAYFLSHFHSDHYVGLSSKWSHGPIYCSRVTANLVRNKLGVDPKYVRELAWEEWTGFGVDGVRVRGLDANHCPGSMLFLFEETRNGGKRVLHCGDFRACPEHLQHPLLVPGKDGVRGQGLDVVYLDTTYLNPKYAFPAQGSVIEACSTMCVKLQKKAAEGEGSSVTRKKGGMGGFMTSASTTAKEKGRLLVIVGTYSIGKERVCLGIAKAMGSKIFAPPNKLKICHQLEDPVLNGLLTSDPHSAQVHMTPLMEIRPETLLEYLNTFKPHFNRIVGFRPSGWNYKPPNSRFTESPAVSTVLHGAGWRSEYSIKEMEPMRGSGREVKCFGVPYSEHSSFRELSMFICGLNVGRVIPTVNIGSAKSRDSMKVWFERWEAEKRKNGLFKIGGSDGKGGQW